MSFPSLPTNNLYAFCCVVGLVAMFYGVTIPANELKDLNRSAIKLTYEIYCNTLSTNSTLRNLEDSKLRLFEKIKLYRSSTDSLLALKNKKKLSIEDRDEVEELDLNVDELNEDLYKLLLDVYDLELRHKLASADYKYKIKEQEYLIQEHNNTKIIFDIVVWGGCMFFIVGFIFWWRSQSMIDKIYEDKMSKQSVTRRRRKFVYKYHKKRYGA